MTEITIAAALLFAALTYVFHVRPWLDEREVRKEMRREFNTSPA